MPPPGLTLPGTAREMKNAMGSKHIIPESGADVNIGAAYVRVSTDDQLEYSPDSQLKL